MFQNWNFARILRLLVAIYAFYEFYRTGEWLFAIPGSMLAMQAIFNTGCGFGTACAPASRPAEDKTVNAGEVEYEEIR